MKSKTNIIINRIGAVLFFLGFGGCCWNEYHGRQGWLSGLGLAMVIIGSCIGNMTIHRDQPSASPSYSPTERDDWFRRSLESLSAEQPVPTRLMLVNLLVREMKVPLDDAKRLVDDYCARNAPHIPLTA
jgi:hypothetical protein